MANRFEIRRRPPSPRLAGRVLGLSLAGPSEARRTDGLDVARDEADARHATVKAAGAGILRPLTDTDYGRRDFASRDPEGDLRNLGTCWPKAEEAPLPG
jgi:hypothetical protein